MQIESIKTTSMEKLNDMSESVQPLRYLFLTPYTCSCNIPSVSMSTRFELKFNILNAGVKLSSQVCCLGINWQWYSIGAVETLCWLGEKLFPGPIDGSMRTRSTRTPTFWDTPRRPMITHTSDSHQIPRQKNTKSKLQISKNCQKFKCWNFVSNFTWDTPSEVAW